MNAQDFIDSVKHPYFFYAGVGSPSGQQYAVCSDYEFPLDFSDLEGSVSENGKTWTWDGQGDPRDCRGNSIYKITLHDDEATYVADLCSFATADGCRDREEIVDYLSQFGLTESQIDEQLSDWFVAAK